MANVIRMLRICAFVVVCTDRVLTNDPQPQTNELEPGETDVPRRGANGGLVGMTIFFGLRFRERQHPAVFQIMNSSHRSAMSHAKYRIHPCTSRTRTETQPHDKKKDTDFLVHMQLFARGRMETRVRGTQKPMYIVQEDVMLNFGAGASSLGWIRHQQWHFSPKLQVDPQGSWISFVQHSDRTEKQRRPSKRQHRKKKDKFRLVSET